MTNVKLKHEQLSTSTVGALLLIVAVALLWHCRDTVHWRDSSEFVLAGTYLDIPHPPGFATYGAFSNLFSLIPFGPLTWRIHLFSIGVTLLCFFFAYQLLQLATSKLPLSSATRTAICCCITLPLLLSPAFIRQSTTAEAYQLNALFILMVLWCGTKFGGTRDYRYLYVAGFLSGVGLGNHPSLLLFVLPGFLLYTPSLGVKRTLISLLFSCAGIAILSFIPIRAQNSPPLNTGSATTIERFTKLVTDARDRHIRPVAVTTIGQLNTLDATEQIRISREDAQKIVDETGWYLAPLGAIAFLTVFIALPFQTATLFFLSVASVMFFFRGWQPDPFTPVFFVLAVLCGLSISHLAARSSLRIRLACLAILVVTTIPHRTKNLPELTAQREHHLAQRAGEHLLNSLPVHAAFLTESSWYLARHLQTVEGVRPDLFLSYVPSFLFPHYFRPVRALVAGESFSSVHKEDPKVPSYGVLGKFLSVATKQTAVLLEPSLATNNMLQKAASVTPEGLISVGPVKPVKDFPSKLHQLGKLIQRLPPSYLKSDAASYLETRALPLAEFLFLQTQESELVISGLQAVCGPPQTTGCSYAVYLKMAQFALLEGRHERARELVHEIIEAKGETPLARQFLSSLSGEAR